MSDSDSKIAQINSTIAKYEDFEDSIDDAIKCTEKISNGLTTIYGKQYEKVKENFVQAIGENEKILDALKFRYSLINSANESIVEKLNQARNQIGIKISDLKDKKCKIGE